jgi:hypothetical protein
MTSSDGEKNKNGRWTKIEIQFMKDNLKTMTYDEMARQLQRNPNTVKKYCMDVLGATEEVKLATAAKFDIQNSAIWKQLKLQFTEEELDVFMYHWQNIMIQFKNETYATERMQMVEMCRLEILVDRCMKRLMDVDVRQHQAHKELADEKQKDITDQNFDKIAKLEQMIGSCQISHKTTTDEYNNLFQRKEAIMKSIKGSREQRLKRIEDSKETLSSFLVKILEDDDLRKKLGLEMKKQALATRAEYERLSKLHEYMDKGIGRPIFNSETVELDYEEG